MRQTCGLDDATSIWDMLDAVSSGGGLNGLFSMKVCCVHGLISFTGLDIGQQ